MIVLYPDGENTAGLHIRPYPLVSISNSVVNNKLYDSAGGHISIPPTTEITLNGTILAGQNSLLINDSIKPDISGSGGLGSILNQRNQLENTLKSPKLFIEICDPNGSPSVRGRFSLSSLNFEEGTWIDSCKYSAVLQADYTFESGTNKMIGMNKTFDQYLTDYGGFIENFSETWSLEPEEGSASTNNPDNDSDIIRIYRVTRNATVVGKVSHHDTPNSNSGLPWQNAMAYFKKYNDISASFSPSHTKYPFSSGLINLGTEYKSYNHLVTENIDKTAGTYTVNESWILASGAGYENYNVTVSKNSSEPAKVNIEGTVKGLTETMASGSLYASTGNNNLFYRAKEKYNIVSDSGKFGIASYVFKRAQKVCADALNPTPVSVSVGANEFNGEITYNIEYDARPANFISGSLTENITINDTYPGDLFAVIPVIGRPTGPVLQYIGGRTEYQRNVTIEAVMSSGYGGDIRSQLAWSKPSLLTSSRASIVDVINALSPSGEPGIRSYFLSPPQETWNPTERRYTLNLTWTYELDR